MARAARPVEGDLFGEGTRGKILRGTARVVAEMGLEGITVQHILDRAGVSRRTFYKSFRDTEDALDGLYEVSTQIFAGTITMAMQGDGDPRTLIERAVDAYLELERTGGRLIATLEAEAVRPRSRLYPRRRALVKSFTDTFEATLKAATGRAPDRRLVRGALGFLESLVLDATAEGPLEAREARAIKQSFLKLLDALFPAHSEARKRRS